MYKIWKSKKIVISILLSILLLVGIQEFNKPKVDRNSYVTLVSWMALLNDNPLIIKEKKVLKVNDIIKTGSSWSLAIIEWWEWSITRLWPDTKIQINKNQISEDLTKIEIFFKMLGDSWKTWSNVVSYIWDESYFKQEFADTEAAVRWTIFEVNLDKDYLFVKKHEVNLKDLKNNKNYTIVQDKPFDIKTFDFIALEKFIIDFQDKTWETINKSLDKDFYKNLKKSLDKSLWQLKQLTNIKWIDIDNLSDLEKNKLYTDLLSSYQNLKPSSISPRDDELYKTKLEYQNILAKLAPENDKKSLLRTSVYDLKEAIDLKNLDDFKWIVSLLGENKDSIDFMDFNKFLDASWLDTSFKKSLDGLIWNFNSDKLDKFMDNGFNWLNNATKKTLNDLEYKLDKIKNIWDNVNLDSISGKISDLWEIWNNFLDN